MLTKKELVGVRGQDYKLSLMSFQLVCTTVCFCNDVDIQSCEMPRA